MVTINPRLKIAADNGGHLGLAYSDHLYMSPKDFLANDFIQWTTTSLGVTYMASTHAYLENGSIFGIMLNRTKSEGTISDENLALLMRHAPHLNRAAILAKMLMHHRYSHKAYSDRAADAPYGLLFVNKSGQLVEVNRRADQIVFDHLGYSCAAGGAVDDAPGGDNRLAALINRATDFSRPLAERFCSFRQIPVDKLGNYLFIAIPLREKELVPIFSYAAPVAAVYVLDLGLRLMGSRVDLLRQSLGLSPREAEIAVALHNGLAPKQIAAELDIAENTVRVFIQRLYSKLSIARQSQLVRLISQFDAAVGLTDS